VIRDVVVEAVRDQVDRGQVYRPAARQQIVAVAAQLAERNVGLDAVRPQVADQHVELVEDVARLVDELLQNVGVELVRLRVGGGVVQRAGHRVVSPGRTVVHGHAGGTTPPD